MNRPWRMGRKGKEECGRTRRTRRRTGKKKEGGMEDKKDDKEEKEELPGGPKMNRPGRMGRRFVKRLLERK